MDQKQWNTHRRHLDLHINWPATKQEIIDACGGVDVQYDILQEFKRGLKGGNYRYTKEEVHEILVDEGD